MPREREWSLDLDILIFGQDVVKCRHLIDSLFSELLKEISFSKTARRSERADDMVPVRGRLKLERRTA